jgi:hypothetical protein
MAAQKKKPYGWSGTVQDFLVVPRQEWRDALGRHYAARMDRPAADSRFTVWEYVFDILQKELKQVVQVKPELEDYTIIFEYEVPSGSRRGPDVTVLGSSVFVLEFVDCDNVIQAHVDATDAYARDVQQHHPQPCQDMTVPVLVCTRAKNMIRRSGDVIILSPEHISDFFNVQAELETECPIDAEEWLAAGS